MMIDTTGWTSYKGSFIWCDLEVAGIIHEYPCGVMGSNEKFIQRVYFCTESALAVALKSSPARFHKAFIRSVDRTYRPLPPEVITDINQANGFIDDFIYESKLYRSVRNYEHTIRDLALRRPYLPLARLTYDRYLKTPSDAHFGRQGILR